MIPNVAYGSCRQLSWVAAYPTAITGSLHNAGFCSSDVHGALTSYSSTDCDLQNVHRSQAAQMVESCDSNPDSPST